MVGVVVIITLRELVRPEFFYQPTMILARGIGFQLADMLTVGLMGAFGAMVGAVVYTAIRRFLGLH